MIFLQSLTGETWKHFFVVFIQILLVNSVLDTSFIFYSGVESLTRLDSGLVPCWLDSTRHAISRLVPITRSRRNRSWLILTDHTPKKIMGRNKEKSKPQGSSWPWPQVYLHRHDLKVVPQQQQQQQQQHSPLYNLSASPQVNKNILCSMTCGGN